MKKYTCHGKRIRVTYIATAMIVAFLMVIAFPWFDTPGEDAKLFVVEVNGIKVGTCEDIDSVNTAYLNARDELEKNSEEEVYIDSEINFYEEDKIFGTADSIEDIETAIYSVLETSTVETKKQAYVVNIEGLTITLESSDAVVELLEAAKAKYDTNNEFDTVLFNDDSSRFAKISYDIISADVLEKYTDNVMAAINSSNNATTNVTNGNDDIFNVPDHIVEIGFEENINITETYVPESHIMSVEDAIELVTKEKEENKIYEVVAGDTLSGIATDFGLTLDELLAMNPDYSLENYIRIGDLITVTVPEPELSVLVTMQKSYEEDYELPVQYIENDSMYTTYSCVLNEGSAGHRRIVANVSYRDGVETDVEILAEEVTEEAVARVVEVGTLTPPTYIRPLSGGRISSYYGQRWGTLHGGVDYACSTGTSVMASSSGVVLEAGWNGSYGYTILIGHPDGKRTRYAHLSRILVSYGQSVSQGGVIGLSGNTGNSTGPHLHFEMIVNGVRVNPLDYLY